MALASVKPVKFHPSERVDTEDLIAATQGFADNARREYNQTVVIDRRSRILRGFRVELPDQTTYPGRVIVHGGIAVDADGQVVFNSDQVGITRSITLEGANTTFYLEIEFTEVDADLDARSFWDPTVDQGTDPSGDEKPDGQELSNSVSTRLVRDWRIVQPVSTSGFERDQIGTIDSAKIPLVKINTDAFNQIVVGVNPELATEKGTTILLKQLSATQILVQNPQDLPPSSVDITVGAGAATQETVNTTDIDRATGVVTVTTLSNTHSPGELIQGSGSDAADFITEANYGPYRRSDEVDAIDFRDRFWQGDEVHGDLMTQGLDSPTDRSDENIQNLKDYVDFLASQIHQLKWGSPNPYVAGSDASRLPLGVGSAFPTTTRYYGNAGSLQGARNAVVTVGDGVSSHGDLDGTDQDIFNFVLSQTPFSGGTGGTLYVKPGTYTLTSNISITSTTSTRIKIICDPAAKFVCAGGGWNISDDDVEIEFDGLQMEYSSSDLGVTIGGTTPQKLKMTGCVLNDVSLNITATNGLNERSSFTDCQFLGVSNLTAGQSPVEVVSILRGKFFNCVFQNTANTASQVYAPGCQYTEFMNCRFDATNGDHAVNLNNSSERLHIRFRDCIFNTDANVCAIDAQNTSDVAIINCTVEGGEMLARFDRCTNAVVENCTRDSQTSTFGFVQFIACIHAKCSHNKFHLYQNPVVEMGRVGILYETYTSSQRLYSVRFNNNHMTAETGGCVGIKIDRKHSSCDLESFHLEDNDIDGMEVGMLFHRSGGTGGTFTHFNVNGNLIGATNPNITIPKVGIWATDDFYNSTFSENTVRDHLPTDATEIAAIAGSSRNGLLFSSNATCYRCSIVNNTFREIGYPSTSGSYATSWGAGIWISDCDNTKVLGNTFHNIYGESAVAILVSDAVNSSYYTVVSNNTLVNVIANGDSGNVHGIYLGRDVLYTTVSGNVMSNLRSYSLSTDSNNDISSGIWMGKRGNYSNTIFEVNIANNNMLLYRAYGESDKEVISGIRCEGRKLQQINIQGNIIKGYSYISYGIVIRNNAYSPYQGQSWNVSNNTIFSSHDGSLIFLEHTAHNCVYVVCTGNSARTGDSADPLWYGFWFNGCNYLTVTGNVVYETAAATTRGDCMYFSNCDYFTVTANTCRANQQTGIDVGGGNNLFIVSSNLCHKSTTSGRAGVDTSYNTSQHVVFGNLCRAQALEDPGTGLNTYHLYSGIGYASNACVVY